MSGGELPQAVISEGESPEAAARRRARELGFEPGWTMAREDGLIVLSASGHSEGTWVPWESLPEVKRALEGARIGELRRMWESLPDSFVVIPEWLSITGSSVYADPDRPPKDLDVLVRALVTPGCEVKIMRIFQAIGAGDVHLLEEKTGPAWSYAPVYDLVARKRPLEIREVDEPEFASQLYKSEIRILHPFPHYRAAGEFYSGDEPILWEKWARRAAELGVPILVQEKYDGFRLIIHRKGADLKVFTEQGRDRASLFPGLREALPDGEYILDAEFVQMADGRPVERWEMAWMGSAAEPPDPFPKIRIAVHDLPWLHGRDLSEKPYQDRLDALRQLLRDRSHGPYEIFVAPTRQARSEQELREAIRWAAEQPGSEGAMLKFAHFLYQPGPIAEVAKFKKAIEIDAAIIGWRTLARARPEGVHWSREEAFRAGREGPSKTYLFRVAIRDGDRWIPLESDEKLTERDLTLDWDEARQAWVGSEDPSLWHMCPRFPHRKAGEYKYANTYAIALDHPPECGQVVTVAPAKFRPFLKEDGSTGYAWMFPRVKEVKPKGSPVAQLSSVLRAFGLEKEVQPWGPLDAQLAIVGDGPGRTEEETGIPFSGPSGQLLRALLEEVGIRPDRTYFTNVFRSREGKAARVGLAEAAERLKEELHRLPKLRAILALSEVAAAALTGKRASIRDLRQGKYRWNGRPLVISFHPAAILRTGGRSSPWYPLLRRDLQSVASYLEKVLSHSTTQIPPEDRHWRFVLQIHFRGRSAHADFRAQISEEILEGWTIAVQQPGRLRDPVESLAEAKAALGRADLWKISWKTGEILPRRVETTIQGVPREVIRPGALRAMPKRAEIASAWLAVEGVTHRPDPGEPIPVGSTRRHPGVFLIVDQGTVEFGARRPWFFEYFLNGRVLRGRYYFRAVSRAEGGVEKGVLPPGSPEPSPREPFFWTFARAKDPTPYVLSQEAVEKRWLPPPGVSALPRAWREKIPPPLRYWEALGEEALTRRQRLAESLEEIAGPILEGRDA